MRTTTHTVLHILATIWLTLLFPLSAYPADQKAPKQIAGFSLGASIEEYDYLSYSNFLKQVIVEDIGEFRKGIIEYGVCDKPGKIVRIKMKYANTEEAYFNRLFRRYKKQLGPPTKYTGDAFGILKAWKWYFTDELGEKVSITLQYNKKDPDENFGSMVKMSLPERIKIERACFNEICHAKTKEATPEQRRNWDQIIPYSVAPEQSNEQE
ncbi:hypothetical protein [Desulfogranum japonicum]|uniref:hypothetical protein n=1 Tax=Desulfogranum japonicum TaxID=231447 RepID=UPI00040EB537|nr:hypothetical protein [Desulfogranum japonicum]